MNTKTTTNFSHFVRSRPVDEDIILVDGHPHAGTDPFPRTHQTTILGLLMASNQDLDVMSMRVLRMMLLSGSFNAIRRTYNNGTPVGAALLDYSKNVVPPARYLAHSHAALEWRHQQAEEKGTALIIRAKSGKVKGILEGGDHFILESMAKGLVNVGGYYKAYLKTREIPARAGRGGEIEVVKARFLVPLPHHEVEKSPEEAEAAWDGSLAAPYQRQASTYAALKDYGDAIGGSKPVPAAAGVDAEDSLAALRGGAKVSLGGF